MTENSSRHKKEISKLKTELKTQQQAHELQLREMRQEFDMTLDRREVEVKSLQSKLHSTTTFHKREVQMITEEAERKQDDNYTEILRLREEIKRTQDSHQDYLSKLMGVLETTQANRNSAHNDEEVLRKKDSEILGLRNEVAKLRKAVPESGSNNSSNQKEVVKSMKYIVKKNREQRKTRLQELGVFAKQLEDSLLLGDRSQMQRTIDSLNNAIQIGEKHNSKMDREVINMIDTTSSFYVPLDATANRNNADYAFLFAENQKLRRKLEKKYTCKRCGHKREKKEYDGAGDIKSEITEESGNAFGASEATMKVGNH